MSQSLLVTGLTFLGPLEEVRIPLRGFDDGVFRVVGFEEGEVLKVSGRRTWPETGDELVELLEPGGEGGGGDLREKEMKEEVVEDEVVPEWCFAAKKEVETGIEDEFG